MSQIVLEWQARDGTRREKIDSARTVTIGRHPGCDIVLGDAHVSRRHAKIFFNGESFHLHNLSRTNPIIFNDRWTLGHELKADLHPDDTFTIGRVRMKVRLLDLSDNGHGDPAHDSTLRCPSCGQPMADERATCPLCRVSIADLETVFIPREE